MSKTIKKVCQCKNCGNESEMVITCSLPEELEDEGAVKSEAKEAKHEHLDGKVKGHAVCSHCGNEADMWIDV